jgi:heptosyltransferase-2
MSKMGMSFESKNIKSILIVKYASIGDLMLATPAFRELRKAYPKAKISLLIGKWSLPVVEDNPNINEFIVIKDDVFNQRKLFDLAGLATRLRAMNFDLVISLHRSLPMSFFSFMVGGKYRLGFGRKNEGLFYNIKLPYNKVKNLHEARKFIELIKLVGGKDEKLEGVGLFHYHPNRA